METVGGEAETGGSAEQMSEEWSFSEINPWMLLAMAALAYYVYQNYLSKLQFPGRNQAAQVTPQDEEKVRKMMEARSKQQEIYDVAAKELEEKRKNEPPPKLGPISKQIAAKGKFKPGELCLILNEGKVAIPIFQTTIL